MSKKNFDKEKFTNMTIAVSCDNRKEIENFCSYIDSLRIKWRNKIDYKENIKNKRKAIFFYDITDKEEDFEGVLMISETDCIKEKLEIINWDIEE